MVSLVVQDYIYHTLYDLQICSIISHSFVKPMLNCINDLKIRMLICGNSPATVAGEGSTIRFCDVHESRRLRCSQRQRSQAMMIALQMPPITLKRFSRQSSIPCPPIRLLMLRVDSQPVIK